MLRHALLTGGVALLAGVALAGCGSSGPAPTSTGGGSTRAPANGVNPTAPLRVPVATRTYPNLTPPPGAPARSVRVPVITYHRVVPVSAVGELDLKVDPATFDAELAALERAGYHSITEAQLFDALYRGAALPSKPVLITFDDGYVDDVRTILPDLLRHHMVATFFVITARFTEPGFVTADQVRELDRAGMDIGDHTAHHVDLRLLTAAQLTSETLGSRRVLQRTLGHFVYAFAYPFGAQNATVRAAVARAGFTLAYTTAGGTTESTTAPLAMPRIHVGRSETPGGLVALLGG